MEHPGKKILDGYVMFYIKKSSTRTDYVVMALVMALHDLADQKGAHFVRSRYCITSSQ